MCWQIRWIRQYLVNCCRLPNRRKDGIVVDRHVADLCAVYLSYQKVSFLTSTRKSTVPFYSIPVLCVSLCHRTISCKVKIPICLFWRVLPGYFVLPVRILISNKLTGVCIARTNSLFVYPSGHFSTALLHRSTLRWNQRGFSEAPKQPKGMRRPPIIREERVEPGQRDALEHASNF